MHQPTTNMGTEGCWWCRGGGAEGAGGVPQPHRASPASPRWAVSSPCSPQGHPEVPKDRRAPATALALSQCPWHPCSVSWDLQTPSLPCWDRPCLHTQGQDCPVPLCPCPQHCPVPTAHSAPAPCCSAGALALPWHTGHREHARAQQLPPACGQQARPGRARDSLGLPAQKLFPPSMLATAQPGGPPWPPPSRLAQEGRGQGSAVQPLATAQALGAGRCLGDVGHRCLAGTAMAVAPGVCWAPHCLSCPCPGRALTKSLGRGACCCSWGGKPGALRGGLKCRGRALPVQTSSSSTVGWQWRNDNPPQHPRAGAGSIWEGLWLGHRVLPHSSSGRLLGLENWA